MARRQKTTKHSFGLPGRVVLLGTPGGWRYSVLTVDGGMLCGRLGGGPLDAETARDAAAALVVELARDVHGTKVEVMWGPEREPLAWTGQVGLGVSADPGCRADQ
ncbi:hypothetical protein ACFWWB_29030 [Streptomyces sp. NPDC058690]|uniref:hypothetical protein n=1 Tax=Streptomyces sp. NPDC058690 TaxID=3346600 RepID=UPI0036460A48